MDSLLPKSYQTELMLGLEEVLREFEKLPVEVIKNFWNPQQCREDLLSYLALYLGVNQWDSTWDVKQKRAVCQNALIVNKQKGTLKSLKEALKALNLNATVTEWWEDKNRLPKGTAEITLQENDIIYSEEQYKVIYKLLEEVKRLSLQLKLKKANAIKSSFYVGVAGDLLNKVSIPYTPEKSKTINAEKSVHVGAAFNLVHRINL